MDVERDRRRDGGRVHIRQRPQSIEQAGREVERRFSRQIPARQVVGGEQHALALEAGIGVTRLAEASQEQAGGHQHDERETDLHRHQRIAHRAAAGRPHARAQRRLRIDPRQLDGRRDAEEQTAQRPERHREGKPDPVDARLESDRELRR